MKIVIPVFQGRVSPVFDWTSTVLAVETDEDGKVISRHEESMSAASHALRAEHLAKMGADVLLCGGISTPMHNMLQARDISVIPWVAGEVDEVLEAFFNGSVPSDRFAMPGCCGRRRKQRGSACRGGNRQGGFGRRRGREPRDGF